MIRWLKRTVSMLTVLVMLVGILPQDAFATTISQGEEDQISRVEWLSDFIRFYVRSIRPCIYYFSTRFYIKFLHILLHM